MDVNSTSLGFPQNRPPELIVDPLIDRFDINYVIRKYLWRLILPPLVFVCLAFAFYQTRQPLFKSSAVILVDPRFDQLLQVEEVGQGQPTDLDSLKSLEAVLSGGSVILRVVEKLGLREKAGFLPADLAEKPDLSDAELVGFLKDNRISATLLPETRLIQIDALDPDPEQARLISETFSSEFEAFLMEQRQKEGESLQVVLEKKAALARESALKLEEGLREFREQNPQFPVEQDHDLFTARLTQFGDEMNAATRLRMQLESQKEALEKIDPEVLPMDVIEVAGYTSMAHVSDLLTVVSASRARLAVLSERSHPDHPEHRTAKAELSRNEDALQTLAKEIKAAVSSKYQTSLNREKLLADKLDALKREFVEMKALSSRFRAKQQQVDREWLIHETLQQRLSESAVSTELSGSFATLVAAPMTPFEKEKPRLVFYLAAGVLAGGLVSGAWLVWNIIAGLPFSHRKQLEQRLGLKVIADWSDPRIAASSAGSTGLLNYLGGSRAKTFQISAPHLNGVGDSVAAAVAETAAMSGRKSLLLQVVPGTFESGLRETSFRNFFRLEISPETVFDDRRFRSGLEQLKASFDNVFIEAGAANDPAIVNRLSALVDQDVVVVGKGGARKEVVEDCIDRLARAGTPSVALMMVDPGAGRGLKTASANKTALGRF